MVLGAAKLSEVKVGGRKTGAPLGGGRRVRPNPSILREGFSNRQFFGEKDYNIKQMIIYKYVTRQMSFLGIANDFAAQKQLKMIQKEVILAIRNSFNLFPIE